MNSTFRYAITIALSSVTAAVSAYEGFDPYSDPTLPTVARASAARSGVVASAKSVSARTVQGESSTSPNGRKLQTHHVVAMRTTSATHRSAPDTRDDARARELN